VKVKGREGEGEGVDTTRHDTTRYDTAEFSHEKRRQPIIVDKVDKNEAGDLDK
jgi:hypothetical protein